MAASVESIIEDIYVKLLATRDIVVFLLARQAIDSDDPRRSFRETSEGLSKRVDKTTTIATTPNAPPLFERIHSEIDWIIAAAQKVAGQM
jgi:hypothetical protein